MYDFSNCSLRVFFLGDNNEEDDRALYARGQHWLQRRHIMGRAVGYYFLIFTIFFELLGNLFISVR